MDFTELANWMSPDSGGQISRLRLSYVHSERRIMVGGRRLRLISQARLNKGDAQQMSKKKQKKTGGGKEKPKKPKPE